MILASPSLPPDLLRQTFDRAPAAIVIARHDGVIELWNAGAERLFGPPAAAALGQNIYAFLLGTRAMMTQIGEIRQGSAETPRLYDCTLLLERGSVRADVAFAPLAERPGEPGRFVLMFEDSELRRRQADAQVHSMRRQRDSLVREVHHRIKNHLHGIIGLLRVQSHHGRNARETIDHAVNQLQSIALVHGIQSEDRSGILGLGALLERVAHGLRIGLGTEIELSPGIEQVRDLAISEANSVSVALVVTELLTNAHKHKQNGQILLNPGRAPKAARIEVRNCGSLGAGFDWDEGKGLGSGLSLVRSLLPSNGARMSIVQSAGEISACLTLDMPRIVFTVQTATEGAR
jgi:PAS domain S-box-containing protein